MGTGKRGTLGCRPDLLRDIVPEPLLIFRCAENGRSIKAVEPLFME